MNLNSYKLNNSQIHLQWISKHLHLTQHSKSTELSSELHYNPFNFAHWWPKDYSNVIGSCLGGAAQSRLRRTLRYSVLHINRLASCCKLTEVLRASNLASGHRAPLNGDCAQQSTPAHQANVQFGAHCDITFGRSSDLANLKLTRSQVSTSHIAMSQFCASWRTALAHKSACRSALGYRYERLSPALTSIKCQIKDTCAETLILRNR